MGREIFPPEGKISSVTSPDVPTKANRVARNQMNRTGLSDERSTASAARESSRKAEYFVSPAVLASRS